MKRTLTLLCCLCILTACRNGINNKPKEMVPRSSNSPAKPLPAQPGIPPFGPYFLFEGASFSSRVNAFQPTSFRVRDHELFRIFNYTRLSDLHQIDSLKKMFPNSVFKQSIFKSPIMLGIKLNPQNSVYTSAGDILNGQNSTYHLADTTEAILVAMGIDDKNVKDYKYHVLDDSDKEVTPWTTPPLQQQYGAKKPYAFLGRYKAPGKRLTVEIAHVNNTVKDGINLDWRISEKPTIAQIVLSTPQDTFDLADTANNHGCANRFDPTTGLPLDFHFSVHRVKEIIFAIKSHENNPYAIYLVQNANGRRDTVLVESNFTGNIFRLNHKYYQNQGNYQLIVQPVNFWEYIQVTRLKFNVVHGPYYTKRYAVKQLVPYALGLLGLLGVLFLIYYRYNQRKLNKAAQQKTMANLQLKSIRSQLNPHFMFNALSAIQNLMNQEKLDGANHYLAKFASLTRKVLHSSEREMISVEDELAILDDYLQMEQLRFGFQYQIEVDESINKANTEIPAMLLQPFIENAVKHGIGMLQKEGAIKIMIKQNERNLILSVQDNGKGFDVSDATVYPTGFGLKLSRERIALLNQIYHSQATMDVKSEPGNTTVTINLYNWL